MPGQKPKKQYNAQKADMQLLDIHKMLYLELHCEFTKSEYSSQSESSLQNFKTLLILKIRLLMGCYMEWAPATGNAENDSAAQNHLPVLPLAAAGADGDVE
jgi:hypothetical protein